LRRRVRSFRRIAQLSKARPLPSGLALVRAAAPLQAFRNLQKRQRKNRANARALVERAGSQRFARARSASASEPVSARAQATPGRGSDRHRAFIKLVCNAARK
jgi:hypothetical protein